MIPYILIFFVAFIVYWKKDNNNLVFCFFMFLCAFMVGSRDMIGGYDVYIYAQFFDSVLSGTPIDFRFEEGYMLFNTFVAFFTGDRYIFFFICALLTYFLHGMLIKKTSPLILFSAFIYFSKFFLMSFVYVRQFIAMGIIWMAIPFLFKNQRTIPILLCLLAFTFHKSSVVFLPFIFLYSIKLDKYKLFFLILFSIGIFMTPIGSVILASLAETSGNDKVASYANASFGVNFFYIFEVLILTYLIIVFSKEFEREAKTRLIFNGCVMYILITIMSLTNATYIRFGWYYYIFIIIGLPYIYLYIKDYKRRSLYRTLIFVYFALMSLRLLIIWDGGDLIPYKAFYIDTERKGRFDYMEYKNNK